MGFRFRKSIKILPGLRLNLSRSGVSANIGVPGANISVGKRGTFVNAGIPGTGVSYRERLSGNESAEQETPAITEQRAQGQSGSSALLGLLVIVAIIVVVVAISGSK